MEKQPKSINSVIKRLIVLNGIHRFIPMEHSKVSGAFLIKNGNHFASFQIKAFKKHWNSLRVDSTLF